MCTVRVASYLAVLVAMAGCWRGGFETLQVRPGEPPTRDDAGTAPPLDAAAEDRVEADSASTDASPADADTADAVGVLEAGVPPFVPTLLGGAEIGGEVNAIAVVGPIAVLATAVVGAQLRVLDVTASASPLALGHAASSCTVLHGVVLAGAYAYAVGEGSPPLLEIFDLTDPSQPLRRGSAALADTGYDVIVAAARAYVVSAAGGDDLEIFDVADPAGPTKLGGLSVLDSYYVRGVDVAGTVAYIGGGLFTAVDVSDPATPTVLDSTTWNEGFAWYGYDLQAVGNLVYGIESNNGNYPQFRIFDVSNPANLSLRSAVYCTNSYVRDLQVVGQYAFVSADDSNDFVDVFDVADPAAPRRVLTTVLRTGGLSLWTDASVLFVGLQRNAGHELEVYALLPP